MFVSAGVRISNRLSRSNDATVHLSLEKANPAGSDILFELDLVVKVNAMLEVLLAELEPLLPKQRNASADDFRIVEIALSFLDLV
jgi:hypothetical protein